MTIINNEWIFYDRMIPCNPLNFAVVQNRPVEWIIVHYTGNNRDTAAGNGKYFRDRNVGTSAHYFVDEEEIIQSVPLKCRAWHAGNKTYNQGGIGIEMCCSGNYIVSETTKQKTIGLIAKLFQHLGWASDSVDKHLIRHYDVTGKECPRQMAGSGNAEWERFKKDVAAAIKGGEPMEKRCQTVNECPDYAKEAISFMVDRKVIADGNKLNMTEDMLRLCVIFYRMFKL